MVAHHIDIVGVVGSSPASPTIWDKSQFNRKSKAELSVIAAFPLLYIKFEPINFKICRFLSGLAFIYSLSADLQKSKSKFEPS